MREVTIDAGAAAGTLQVRGPAKVQVTLEEGQTLVLEIDPVDLAVETAEAGE